MMNKKFAITTAVVGVLTLAVTVGIQTSNGNVFALFSNNINRGKLECSHNGFHYAESFPTDLVNGHREFWTCCKCHQTWLSTPESGNFTLQDFSNASGIFSSSHDAYLPVLTTKWESGDVDSLKDGIRYGYHTISVTNDIDLDGDEWNSAEITASQNITIEGNNHTLKNFTINDFTTEGSGTNYGKGGAASYYCGFVGNNLGTLVLNNLTFDGFDVDMKNFRSESEGSSCVGIVIGNNSGTATLSNVNVINSSVIGYTKIGGLVGYNQLGTFMANYCSLSNNTIGLENDGIDIEDVKYCSWAGVIVGYAPNTSVLTNGIKLTNNSFANFPEDMAEDNFDYYEPTDTGTVGYYTDGTNYYWGYSPTYVKDSGHSNVSTVFSYFVDDYGYETEEQYNKVKDNVTNIGSKGYKSLEEAIEDAKSGDTIKINSDIDLSDHEFKSFDVLDFEDNVTLDLNGKTITNYNFGIIYQGNGLTIKNGTINVLDNGSYAIAIGDERATTNVVIENVVCNAGINCYNTTATIVNCVAAGNAYHAVWADEYTTVTIESGTYTKGNDAIISCEGITGFIYAKGGTYDADPSAYLADGYEANKIEDVWVVSKIAD